MYLIDNLYRKCWEKNDFFLYHGARYLRRPVNPKFWTRVKDAWMVFKGKGIAIYFIEDMIK